METTLIIVIVVVFVAAIYVVFRQSALWKEYYASAAHNPDKAIDVFSKLSRNGVRTRLQNMGGSRGGAATGAGVTIYVLVHRLDLYRAREIAPIEDQ